MLKISRAVRIKEDVSLPSGKMLTVNCNVEAILPDILRTYAVAVGYAEEMQKSKDFSLSARFYDAYAEFLKTILGAENWQMILDEFDLDVSEVCEAFAAWSEKVVIPAVGEASKKNMEKRKRLK